MKRQRQALIEKLIRTGSVASQRQLVGLLAENGFTVSQTTVSRDLSEMGFSRGRGPDGGLSYLEVSGDGATRRGADEALKRLAPQVLLSAEPTGNIVVVKTSPGNAQGLAWAVDRAEVSGIAGTVAGDDTIMVICSKGAESDALAGTMLEYAGRQR